MHRHALLTATVVVAALALTACGSGGPPTSPAVGTVQPAAASSMVMPDYRGQTAGSAASAIRASLGNVSITAPGGDAGTNAIVTGTDPTPGQTVSASTSFVLYTNYLAPAPAYTPPPTTEAPPPTSDASDSAGGDSGSTDTGSSSGGSVDLPHVPHPHAHVCVGGKHIHVCS